MLTQDDTRKVHVHQMLLDGARRLEPLEIVKHLGYIQLDSIFVVARSQDLVLHCRRADYVEESIWDLQAKDILFEEFAHARSLIHRDEFPYYYRKMLDRRGDRPKWFDQVKGPEELVQGTLEYIRDNGEITTSDVPVNTDFKSRWSGLNKRILDYLTVRGHIYVSRREGFSTVYYDLIENSDLPVPEEDEMPTRMESFWRDIDNTLSTHGLVPLHRLLQYTYSQRQFTYRGKKQSPRRLVKQAIKERRIEEHTVDGTSTRYYSHPGWLDEKDIPSVEEPVVNLLSPFDNILWSREALEDQYGFSYKFEAYTPAKDRVYGFYSLPILYGTNFVGRVDPKLDRSSGTLHLRQWTWEKRFEPSPHFWDELGVAVSDLADFHGADDVEYGDLNAVYERELNSRL